MFNDHFLIDFSWSDGSVVDYTYWALSMPLTGGLTFCGYTITEDGMQIIQ